MGRAIRNSMIVFSLIVCVAGSVLWIRSLEYADTGHFWNSNHDFIFLSSSNHRVGVMFGNNPNELPGTRFFDDGTDFQFTQYIFTTGSFQFCGVHYCEQLFPDSPQPVSTFTFRAVFVPHWLIVMLAAMPPLWWLLRGRRSSKHYRHKHGLCVAYGYDLRGTVGDCPECGRTAPL